MTIIGIGECIEANECTYKGSKLEFIRKHPEYKVVAPKSFIVGRYDNDYLSTARRGYYPLANYEIIRNVGRFRVGRIKHGKIVDKKRRIVYTTDVLKHDIKARVRRYGTIVNANLPRNDRYKGKSYVYNPIERDDIKPVEAKIRGLKSSNEMKVLIIRNKLRKMENGFRR